MTTNGLGVVPSPPAEPPVVGLIAALSGPYLIDDTGQPLGDVRNPGAPGAPDHGLDPTIRWEGAVRYNPEQVCYTGDVQDPCSPHMGSIPANPGLVEAQPYLVWAGDRCSTFGWSAHDFTGRAMRALLAAESKQIAKELWTGHRAQAAGWPNAYLAGPDAHSLSVSALDPATALDFLEQGLADCSTGARGVIHCTRQLGSILSGLGGTLRNINGTIQTYVGTIIIPDAGYDGSGPAMQPASNGHQWAYATLMPTVRRSPIEVLPGSFEEAIIRGTNDLEFRAERYAVATLPPCCVVAVEVNLPLPSGGIS